MRVIYAALIYNEMYRFCVCLDGAINLDLMIRDRDQFTRLKFHYKCEILVM